METLANLGDGFAIAITWQNLLLALLGCFLGTIMGALPGLGPSNGVAILIPLAFTLGLGATPSLILLTSVYYGAMYGGRISSILLGIPGDEPAMMTVHALQLMEVRLPTADGCRRTCTCHGACTSQNVSSMGTASCHQLQRR